MKKMDVYKYFRLKQADRCSAQPVHVYERESIEQVLEH